MMPFIMIYRVFLQMSRKLESYCQIPQKILHLSRISKKDKETKKKTKKEKQNEIRS